MGGDMDTSGFYRLDDGVLLYAPNAVMGADLELLRSEHASYTYPILGWYWFDTEAAAREYFDLPPEEPTP
jgi:hypothetical protein